MSVFDELVGDVEDGMHGRNAGIPMGFSRLNKHVSIRKSTNYLLGGYTGCITGDAIIEVARKQATANTNKYRLDYLYFKLHQRGGKDAWDLSLPTRVKVFMPDKGQTSVHYIKDVVYSGIKPVWEVTTTEGLKIKATEDHKFMVTESGKFKKLCDLFPGDEVVVKCEKQSRVTGRKLKHRKEICGKYPYYWGARSRIIAGKKYQRVYDYRVAYDTSLNNLSVEQFLKEVSTNRKHKLILSNPKYVIHHIDENPLNNNPSNLRLMSKKEHDKLHAKTSNYGYSWVKLSTIKSIEYIGEQETFDIYCSDPYHNFLANDFVVHNSGKTSLLDDAFVLNPLDWYIPNFNRTEIRLKIKYWSMERPKKFKFMKWISRKIFLDTGRVIAVERLMGWCPVADRLTLEEHDIFLMYRDYLEALLEIVEIFDGSENPTGIRNFMKAYHLSIGKVEEIDEFHKTFVPNNPHLITLKIKDHVGKIKKERGLLTKKEAIDKASDDDIYERDFYGTSCVNLSQFNRDIANPMRIKNGDVEPMMEDFKETGNTQEDADVVLSLFDPMRYKVPDPSGYDLTKLRDREGRKKYRALRILKNSYGAEDIRIGLAFQPQIGMFKEMPKIADTNPFTYEQVLDNSYFLPETR